MKASRLASLLERAGSREDPAIWHREQGAWTSGGGPPGRDVRELAAALLHYGAGEGRSVLVLGAEGPDTSRAALAVVISGACLVRVDAGAPDDVVLRALRDAQVALALVGDDRQLQRVLALRPDLPELEMVILLSGEPSERKAAALLVGAAVDVGAALLRDDPSLLSRTQSGLRGEGIALLVHAGGAMRSLTRDALAAAADRLTGEVPTGSARSILVALGPEAPEAIPVVLGGLARDATVLVVGRDEPMGSGLREKAPDAAVVSPEALRRLHAEWAEEFGRGAWWKRSLTSWALREGADPRRHPRRFRLAEALVLSRLRNRWGGRLRRWGVVGGPVDAETTGFFAAAGLPIYVIPGVATAGVAR